MGSSLLVRLFRRLGHVGVSRAVRRSGRLVGNSEQKSRRSTREQARHLSLSAARKPDLKLIPIKAERGTRKGAPVRQNFAELDIGVSRR